MHTIPPSQPPPFELFGAAHIVVMVLTVAVPAAMSVVVRRARSEKVTRAVCVTFAALLAVNQVTYWSYRFVTEGALVFLREHLPLHMCSIAVVLSIVLLLTRARLPYELTYFWGLAGTSNAIVTPELTEGFPDYHFFQYFISHVGIVATALFATFGLRMRPDFRSLVRAFLYLNVLAAALAPLNLALGSNYLYLCEAPVTASPFLLFPWPGYLIWLEVLALAFFALLYLPVYLGRRAGASRIQET
ncbi:MAG: TIGR02206 family membrane protein [Gemmatimonadetes bacterium]|nr:TIGR02206 family membrane protein [Gemmatimonadota bacterium]